MDRELFIRMIAGLIADRVEMKNAASIRPYLIRKYNAPAAEAFLSLDIFAVLHILTIGDILKMAEGMGDALE